MAKPPVPEALSTWIRLNDELRDADEAECRMLLELELKGRRRSQFIKRIHSRLTRVRRQRERHELFDDGEDT